MREGSPAGSSWGQVGFELLLAACHPARRQTELSVRAPLITCWLKCCHVKWQLSLQANRCLRSFKGQRTKVIFSQDSAASFFPFRDC